jgi:hypothetical protein
VTLIDGFNRACVFYFYQTRMKAIANMVRSCRDEQGGVIKGIVMEIPIQSASSIALANETYSRSHSNSSATSGTDSPTEERKVLSFKLPIHEVDTYEPTAPQDIKNGAGYDETNADGATAESEWTKNLASHYQPIGIPEVKSFVWFDHIWCMVPSRPRLASQVSSLSVPTTPTSVSSISASASSVTALSDDRLAHTKSTDSLFGSTSNQTEEDVSDDEQPVIHGHNGQMVMSTITPDILLQHQSADHLDLIAARLLDMDISLSHDALLRLASKCSSAEMAIDIYLNEPDSYELENPDQLQFSQPSPILTDNITPLSPISPTITPHASTMLQLDSGNNDNDNSDVAVVVSRGSRGPPTPLKGDLHVDFELEPPIDDSTAAVDTSIDDCTRFSLPPVTEEMEKQYTEEIKRLTIRYLQQELEKCATEGTSESIGPIFHTLLGHLYTALGDTERAVESYANGRDLISQRKHMQCVARKFVLSADLSAARARSRSIRQSVRAKVAAKSESQYLSHELSSFLAWGYGCSPIVGLQAYRLVTELMHRKLAKEIERLCGSEFFQSLDDTFRLDHHGGVSSSTTGHANITNMLALMQQSQKGKKDHGFERHVKDFADGVLKQVNLRSDVLNEIIEVTNCSADPVDLSINILTRLRELLKENSLVNSNSQWTATSDGYRKAVLNPDFFDGIITMSAFKTIELEACQLQAVNLTGLTTSQRIVFFVNVYNLAVIQGLIASAKRGGAGVNLYERTIFMRSVKYNIAGNIYNLLDVSIP